MADALRLRSISGNVARCGDAGGVSTSESAAMASFSTILSFDSAAEVVRHSIALHPVRNSWIADYQLRH
jgi:hypothetical protein